MSSKHELEKESNIKNDQNDREVKSKIHIPSPYEKNYSDSKSYDQVDESEVIHIRRQKLEELKKKSYPYPNDFKRTALAKDLHNQYGAKTQEELEKSHANFTIAGRIVLKRVMGKASFIHIQDMSDRIQIYLAKNLLPEGMYEAFTEWDIGDIVGAEGVLFKTKTGELSLKASHIQLLVKSIRPLPDKFHGLADTEIRHRKRYLDLIVNEESRKVFLQRSKIVSLIRKYFNDKQYIEVETPMMQSIPGGAAARPFITHHNTLKMDLYLRIAPELYLKRLVVGGFERVYEINRNFRNEGISTQHNPEFTMLEFYQAYSTYEDLMNLTEDLFKTIAKELLGTMVLNYQGQILDLTTFKRIRFHDSILQFNQGLTKEILSNFEALKKFAQQKGITCEKDWDHAKIIQELFEETVEDKLIHPTFITHYPAVISPLARLNDEDPALADRFELFIMGRELANGFSELNDPMIQAEKFKDQVRNREKGDLEAMYYDEDYITALEHGMPPTAGTGIGIDRLVMLFTNTQSIRDVILFPILKKVND